MATLSTLTDWTINTNTFDSSAPYRAPELGYCSIIGRCSERGKVVITSEVAALDEAEPHVVTASGSLYVLGAPREGSSVERIRRALKALGRD
jgi:hypothetical protein